MSQAPGAQPSRPSVYHERQRLELCAVHALNNVLQQQLFSQEAADEICKRLAPDSRLNPHRSLRGTGNYDVNVIMAALQGLGLATVWWDRRRWDPKRFTTCAEPGTWVRWDSRRGTGGQEGRKKGQTGGRSARVGAGQRAGRRAGRWSSGDRVDGKRVVGRVE
uniref:ubiquitinyl hydrolase 1 n=1 Tax=Panthera tigris altaica TaxID=74533 RepID=A0A8C9L437_PANTA